MNMEAFMVPVPSWWPMAVWILLISSFIRVGISAGVTLSNLEERVKRR